MGSSPAFHRSKCALGFVAAAAASCACGSRDSVTLRTVTMHVPAACAIDGGAYAEYYALGDYEPPGAPAKGHFLRDVGADLSELDPAARELVVVADENDRTWTGRGPVGPAGDIDVLLLPLLASCPLTGSVGARVGTTLASIGGGPGGRVLVVGGNGVGMSGAPPSPAPQTFIARLDTGEVDAAVPDLRTPRTRGATVTPFGEGALVAGGVGEDGAPLYSAEVFDATAGGFDQKEPAVLLSEVRSEHGATTLATGETLLVGGVGADGTTVLSSMEIVDPASRTVRVEGVARLAVARRNPTVLRLASGEILVAGGYDAAGPVTRFEWFVRDASAPTRCSADLVAGSARSFIALPGGGALAVVAPPAGAQPNFPNVWVIGSDCVVASAAPIAGALTKPVLFGGAGGAPILWTGDRWLQWSPWSGAFVALAVLDDVPARFSDAWNSGDPGLAVWLDASTSAVTTLRFDTRGAYSALPSSILLTDAAETAPDRLAASGVVSFDASLGALVMAPGAGAFVTDRTYADVAVDVATPTGEPPVVVLRDSLGNELEVGGVSCLGPIAGGVQSLHVERHGATVSWSAGTGSSGTCAAGVGSSARVSVGFRGAMSSSRSVARDVRVQRLGQP